MLMQSVRRVPAFFSRPSIGLAAAWRLRDGYISWKGEYTLRVYIVQELCESRGGRPGLSVLTSLLASVDVKIY